LSPSSNDFGPEGWHAVSINAHSRENAVLIGLADRGTAEFFVVSIWLRGNIHLFVRQETHERTGTILPQAPYPARE
jgi:hypothetical protein